MKSRRGISILLMIWPYLTAGTIFGLLPIDNQPKVLFMVLLALMTLVLYILNIINACTHKIEELEQSAFWNMLVKLVHIPFYMVMFVIGLGVLATSWLPGLIFFTPFIVMMFVVVDYCLTVTSSSYGINVLIRARKEGALSTKFMALHLVMHLCFVLDVISAISVFVKLRKAKG